MHERAGTDTHAAPATGVGPVGPLRFTYHRAVAPQLGMLLGIAIAETLVVHLLVTALWGWRAALAVGVIDLGAVLLLVALLRSLERRPVLVDAGGVTLSLGFVGTVRVPRAAVAGTRADLSAADLRRRGALKLSGVAFPNVALRIDPPLPRSRNRAPIDMVAHRLDEPAAFIAAIDALRAGHVRSG